MLKKQLKVQFQKDNKKIKIVIVPTTYKIEKELTVAYAVAYRKAIEMGVATRSSMLELLKKEKIWGDDEEELLLQKGIETAVLESNLKLKMSTADKDSQKFAALKLVAARSALLELIQIKSGPLEHTAESIAEDVRIDKLLSLSTFTEDDGKPYFINHDDFLSRRGDLDVLKIYNALIEELSKDNIELLRKLPENEWLITNGLMDLKGKVNEKELLEALVPPKKEEEKEVVAPRTE